MTLAVEVLEYPSFEAFFAWELRQTRKKHEYFDGVVRAMAGGGANHALIGATVIALLRGLAGGSKCRVYTSNLMLRIVETNGAF
jgi:Uma2 family endonuclease